MTTPDPLRAALDDLRRLDEKHFRTTRQKRPDWEVCDFDSMTWPCDTQKALSATDRALAADTAPLDVERLEVILPDALAEADAEGSRRRSYVTRLAAAIIARLAKERDQG